jgi:hypothetical protein
LAKATPASLQNVVTQVFSVLLEVLCSATSELCDEAVAASEAIACLLDESMASEAVCAMTEEILGPIHRERPDATVVARAEAAARIAQSILVGAKVPPTDSSSILLALLPLSLKGSSVCSAAMVHVQKAYGSAVLAEEIPKIHGALLDAGAVSADLLSALIPIMQHGLSAGDAEQREQALQSQVILIKLADDGVLGSMAVKIAGPLVRAMTPSANPGLVSSLIRAVDGLLAREGAALRPLYGAIQTALLKYLDEKWPEDVHAEAAQALGSLSASGMKPDALLKALCKPPSQTSHFAALDSVLAQLSQPLTEDLQMMVNEYRKSKR